MKSHRPPGQREAYMPPSAVQITIDRLQPPLPDSERGFEPPAPSPAAASSLLPTPRLPGPASSISVATRASPSNKNLTSTGRGAALLAGSKMAAGVAELRRLEWWLEELEQCINGGDNVCGPRKVADELVKVQVSLNNIAGKRERIKILFKKIEDVIKYLDPQYIDRVAVPDAMKLQFILAEEQVIPSRAALLEEVKNLQPILDSASIQAPDHAAKLQRLSQIHIQQQEQRHDLTDSVKTLLEDYNKMTLLLSKQFVQWNEILMHLEAAKEVKPIAE
ncbi:dynactin subunit 3 isoform X2 [Athene cunicularia]|uniref:dynactin subunit 3 isoform X2 n=1 Tax=Athene cunicularia TaxID=194338 RepID=UPI000EF64D57|nr:dynactin subunit 3 isoform X2 [Athene cunicularia]